MTHGIRYLAEEMMALGELAERIRLQILAGKVPDLAELSDRTAEACQTAQGLPPPERERVFPAVLVLMDMVNRLSETLKDARDGAADRLTEDSARRRAITAYNRPPDKKN